MVARTSGISLKEKPDGSFVTLASFFAWCSPHGRYALVLLQSPQTPKAG
jgi:hypothetical protein